MTGVLLALICSAGLQAGCSSACVQAFVSGIPELPPAASRRASPHVDLKVFSAVGPHGVVSAFRPRRVDPGERTAPTTNEPQRIVCLIPNVTQMLFAIGAGGQVVGVSSFAHDPPEADKLPKVGGLLDPDTERILALRPDLAIVYASQQELQQRLTRAGIRLYVYRHGNLADVMKTIRGVGVVTGRQAEADRVATAIERDLTTIADRVKRLPRPKTLLVFGREPHSLQNLFASGGYGFLHDMVVTAGGADVFDDIRKEAVQASTEMILARAPDVIIELRYGASAAQRPDSTPWQRVSSVPAVRNRRIYELTGDEFVEGGIRVADATKRIAELLHPEAFR